MEVVALDIPDIKLFRPQRFGDERGFFCETYRRTAHADYDFVQDNVSVSAESGTIRGLHFQAPPFAQAKLITVLRGAVLDVAVDIRRGSPSFGNWVSWELSAENFNQLLIPAGFAHGFCTLVPDTMIFYKVDAYYSRPHDCGILWNDPALGIVWPVEPGSAILSDRDRKLPRLSDIESPFVLLGAGDLLTEDA
jgi:dTDP-4-dehydrorhamnose 3,5-epimerase